MTAIRVLVADDHPLVTQGLVNELKPFGIEQVDAVSDGAQVVRRFLDVRPDVLVLDLRLDHMSGLSVARDLLSPVPEARIVFYSQFDRDHIVREAYRIGGKAFVPKTADISVLAQAILAVHDGGTFFLPEVAERLALMSVRGEESPHAKLSPRDMRVFKMMAQGLTIAEIAVEEELSTKTAGLITQRIKESLGISRPADITRLALKYQVIDE
jgi:DNA-binding NarL/FixJ family response regulator